MTYRVLIAEDDDQIAGVLSDYLVRDGFGVQRVADGREALRMILDDEPSVVILDVTLPGMDGIAVCRTVRHSSTVPILMLTALSSEEDRLNGLNSGADDYVCKPFSPREIVARVHALLRRADPALKVKPVHTGFVIGSAHERVLFDGQPVPFTRIEERLFRTMAAAPRRVFTREALINAMSAEMRDIGDRAIDTHVKNLRRKLKSLAPDRGFIHAMYGVGYYFEEKAESSSLRS
ncbi:response regulator [Pseudoduganella rivuli]|nr:response regulator [Pseudoduganella rivuli]